MKRKLQAELLLIALAFADRKRECDKSERSAEAIDRDWDRRAIWRERREEGEQLARLIAHRLRIAYREKFDAEFFRNVALGYRTADNRVPWSKKNPA